MPAGSLYMIPVPLAEQAWHTLSPEISTHSRRLQHFFVENLREARRFLKAIDREINIDALSFCEMNRNTEPDLALLKRWLQEGRDVGVLSDAGCPGIADPGALLAELAHRLGARVVPLTGPSSVLLALMASGLNGQCFCFNGYLPLKDPERSRKIRFLEADSAKDPKTQIFIETPYRNNNLLADLLKNCQPGTRLCIAMNLTAADEFLQTKTISDWKKLSPDLPKQAAIFLLQA